MRLVLSTHNICLCWEIRKIILSLKGIAKTLIRLCGCAGWSVPLMFAYNSQDFSHRGPYLRNHIFTWGSIHHWACLWVVVCFIWFFMSWSTIFQFCQDTSSLVAKINVVLLKDTTQWCQWGSNPQPFNLESSTLPLSHCAPCLWMDYKHITLLKNTYYNTSFAHFHTQFLCLQLCKQLRIYITFYLYACIWICQTYFVRRIVHKLRNLWPWNLGDW